MSDGIRCDTCDWRRRVPERTRADGSTYYPFNEAWAGHSWRNPGHGSSYPCDPEGAPILTEQEEAVGAAWLAGYFDGREQVRKDIIEAVEDVK